MFIIVPQVLVREGYKDAMALLSHSRDIKEELEGLVRRVGVERVRILCSAPQTELDKLKPHMEGRLPVRYAVLDPGAVQPSPLPRACQDTHLTLLGMLH